MSFVHRIKCGIFLGALLFPLLLLGQTTQTGRFIPGPAASRPTCNASPVSNGNANPGDVYDDTDDANTYKCTATGWQSIGGGGGGSPGGVNHDTQCNSTGTFAACANNTNVRYASGTGNDSNSGLTWDSAKFNIIAAVQALPGGSSTVAGQGTVYVGPGAGYNPSSTAFGIWLMGANDPNFASPPSGWLKCTGGGSGCNLYIVGVPNGGASPNGHKPRVLMTAGSQQGADTVHPGIWLSNVAGVWISNLQLQYFGRAVVVGECSNNTRTGLCQVTGVTFDNVGGQLNQIAGNGPCTDITGSSFWIWFRDYTCGGNAINATGAPTSNSSAAILMDGSTNTGIGLIHITDTELAAGGIKVIPGTSGAGLYADNIIEEGDFVHQMPPTVWFTSYPPQTDCRLSNIQIADATGSTTTTVENDGGPPGCTILNTLGIQGVGVTGPAIILNQDFHNFINETVSPRSQGQVGFFNGYEVGETDVARRITPLTPTRFTNLAASNTAVWQVSQFSGISTITQGVTDPFGGTAAATATSTSTANENLYLSGNGAGCTIGYTPNVGDWIVIGAWTKQPAAGTSTPIVINECSFPTPTFSTSKINQNMNVGDGQWFFQWTAAKVSGGLPTRLGITGIFSSTSPLTAYGPLLYVIPAGTISDNEVLEFAASMNSIDSACTVGTVCDVTGHTLSVNQLSARTTITSPNAAMSQYFDIQQVNSAPGNPTVAGCRLYVLAGVTNGVSNTGTNCLPSGGGGGGGNVSSTGSPTNGQLSIFTNATTITGSTLLPTGNFPALTQDVNNTAGSLVTTVNGIKGNPVPTLASGFLNWNGSVFSWSTPPTNVGGGATTGDLAQYNSATTVNDSGVVAANVVTNSTNLVNTNLVQGTGNHTVSDSTIAVANVTQNTTSGTTNAIPKWSGPHTLTNSVLTDNGTVISTTENVDLKTNALVGEFSNATTTGTTTSKLAKLTGAPSTVVLAATTDTSGIIGICTAGCGTTGTAQISLSGQASCVFDGGTTAGDYVQISIGTAGDCTDTGVSRPTSGQIIGRVLSTNGVAGTYVIDLYTSDLTGGSGGGGGSGTINAASQFSIPYYSGAGSNNIISGVAAPTSPNNVPYFLVSTASAGAATAPQALLAGVPVNSALGTTPYNMATTDRASLLQGNPTSPFVINLPNGGTSGFAANFPSVFRDYGTAVFSLVAPTGINLNGVSAGTLSVLPNWTAWMWQDGSNNLWLSRVPTYEGFGSTCANGLTWSTSTGIGCLSGLPLVSGTTAGGDLSGTYPNPTVAQINGGAVPVSALAVGTNASKQLVASAVQGTDTKLMTAGTINVVAGSGVCLDINGGLTTVSCAGVVNSLTGDGALITNSVSTGAVTLTLGTAAAHKVWMNNTGSTATPGYQSIGTGDLPTGIPNANLANASTTPNGQTCTLGSTCNVNSGAAAHTVALNEGAGSAITGITCSGGQTIQGATGADPICTTSPTLGVQNTTQSTVTLSGSATAGGVLQLNNIGTTPATTIIGTAATTTNTILGFATAPTNKAMVTCATASTTCTLTGIDFPERYFVPAANCKNTTAGTGWSIGAGGSVSCRAGTNNLGGFITITDTSTTFAQFTLMIPFDWDTATNPYIRFYFSSATDTTNGHTVIPQVKVSCPTAGNGTVSDDATFSAAQSSSTVTFGASAVANGFYNGSSVQFGATQMTGCIAGGMMIVQVGRATDTATGNINFYGADVTFPRLLTPAQAN